MQSASVDIISHFIEAKSAMSTQLAEGGTLCAQQT
jgi:hypothetical protein